MKARLASICSLLMWVAAAAGCNDMTNAFLAGGPSPVTFKSGGFVDIDPENVTPVVVTGVTCATGTAFAAPFTLVIGPSPISTLTLVDVRFEFVDTQGLQLPSTTLGPDTLARQFGELSVPRFSSRTFALTFESGCTARSTGMLTVFVTTSDSTGTAQSSVARVHIQ